MYIDQKWQCIFFYIVSKVYNNLLYRVNNNNHNKDKIVKNGPLLISLSRNLSMWYSTAFFFTDHYLGEFMDCLINCTNKLIVTKADRHIWSPFSMFNDILKTDYL